MPTGTLIYQLKTLYAVERISQGLISKVSKRAFSSEFGDVLRSKREISADQVALIKACAKLIDCTLTGAKSKLIDGAVDEIELLVKTRPKDAERDLLICCIAQSAVHSQLSVCESAIAHARALNQPDMELLLLKLLGEERTFDSNLSLWREAAIGAQPQTALPNS